MIRFLTWLIFPMTLFGIGMILVVICHFLKKKETAHLIFALSLCWLFIWGTGGVPNHVGIWLENRYPPLPMDKVPHADVIILLGGSMGAPQGKCIYPELFAGADRVWHAARLYHAGKAPVIIPSGCSEAHSSAVLLRELGVPASAIVVEDRAVNTIENGRFSKELMLKKGYTNALLVTSAFHMRRAEMIFKTVGVQAVPVATDHEVMYGSQESNTLSWLPCRGWMPDAGTLEWSAWYLKEIFGYWGDVWRLRRNRR